jgi:polyvinyl alcohol dehydrogenase (cytochrome)
MNLRISMRSAAIGLVLGALAPAALAQTPASAPADHPGKAVYDRSCASCHDNPGTTRAATLAAIQAMSPGQIRSSLTEGKMQPMAASLSSDEITQLVGWLTINQKPVEANWSDKLLCAADKRTVDLTKPVAVNGFSVDRNQTRSLTAAQAGLKASQMKNLDVAWAIGYPGSSNGTGVSIVGDTMFAALSGRLMALDTASGCAKWSIAANSRNTPTIGEIDGRKVVALSVGQDVLVVDATTGEQVWRASAKATDNNGSIRGGVAFDKDKIIVPISASGVATGGNAKFECCIGHGAVVALSAKDGSKLWEYHTMPTADYNGKVSSTGVKQRGPSGAPIWSVPLVDEKRNRIIVTTGENTSFPGTDTSDAVIALDADTGKEVWKFQAMSADVWNMACGADKQSSGPNCPWNIEGDPGVGRDFDFGAGAILAKGAGGKDVILAGQKSGDVWALDAATGKKLWNIRFGKGSALGGVHWGFSTDGSRVFAAINDPIPGDGAPHPGVYAVDIKTGKQVWGYDAKPDCAGDRGKAVASCEQKAGFSAAPVTVDGAVIAATLDGKVFVFDGKTGEVLKTIDTIGQHATINGVDAKGGSIDAHGLSAGAGMVFVNAGYGAFGQTPGNVLIALKPTK